MDDLFSRFDRDGFAILDAVFPAPRVEEITQSLESAFEVADPGVMRTASAIYGARNVLQLWPGAADVCREPRLKDFVLAVLGPKAGVVRALFFDKPPEQSWTLPPHRDLTIAVREHRSGTRFSHSTTKAGVPHYEAPPDVLERMLTLRVHLDPMTAENGPLTLVPGSHRDEGSAREAVTPLGPAGDVLAMRPLVVHGSRHTKEGTQLRRRVLHLELAAMHELPDGIAWHDFVPVV
jgi:hypothetical protein